MSDRDFDDARKRRQLEHARLEREQAEQKKRDDAAATKRSREPHGQAGMTAIERRILKRAEAHMKIAAEVRAGNFGTASKAKPSARKRWDEAIEKATVGCNGDRRRAVALVARQNPKLREQLVAEANSR